MRRLPAVAAVMVWSAAAQATPVGEVPDPRPTHHVVDLTGTLTDDDVRAIDESAARAAAEGELLVVVVSSTDGVAPRAWTTSLFNRLRVDTQSRNRGVMLMAALGDHRAEIVLGEGYPLSTTAQTDAVMREVIVPQFRAGAPRRAVVDGAQAVTDRVVLAPPSEARPAPVYAPPAYDGGRVEQAQPDDDHGLLFAGAGGGGAMAAGLAMFRVWRRKRPRTCAQCQKPLMRLDEVADDAHLSSGERVEEQLGSVDYDVWHCAGCGFVEKCRYGAWFTSYGACPACQSRTLSTSSQTLEAATTYSTGLVEVTEQCQHCSHHATSTRVTPRLPEPTTNDSSSSSGYSGGGDSGGSSSGAGSSGSW